jgi:hypothetical protein
VWASVLFLAPRDAQAMGAVVGPPDATIAIAHVRTAVAVADGHTTRWAQITTTPTSDAFAWLVPVLPGARIDLASDAWLDALDAATVPVVLPPKDATPCLVSLSPDVLTPATSPSSQSPAAASVAIDLPTLTSFLTAVGLTIPADLDAGLASVFSSGGAVLALVYAPGTLPVRTLRIVDTGPPLLPFALTGNPAAAVGVTAFAIGGSELAPAASALVVPPSSVLWLSTGGSSYASVVASLLGASGGNGWLVESTGPSEFFASTTATPFVSLPSVIGGYYALASQYGDIATAPAICAAAAESTEAATAPYASACAPGALAVVPGPLPCAASDAGATPVASLACGAAVDAALAVGGLSPGDLWVTRIVGIVTATSASNVPLVGAGAVPESPVSTASGYVMECALGGFIDAGDGDGGYEGGYDDGGYEGGIVEGEGDDFGGFDGGGIGLEGGLPVVGAIGGSDSTEQAAEDLIDDDPTESDGCGGSSSDDDDGGGCGGDTSSSDDSSGGCSGSSSTDNSNCSSAGHGSHRHRTRGPASRIVLALVVGLAFARRLGRRRG